MTTEKKMNQLHTEGTFEYVLMAKVNIILSLNIKNSKY